MGDRIPADYGLDRALDVPPHKMTDESFLRASLINAREFWPDVKIEIAQQQKAIEALNICIKQDDEREAELKKTIDALVAALESEMASTKDEGLWPNPKALAALALARGGK